MKTKRRILSPCKLFLGIAAASSASVAVNAADANSLLEEVVITATKKSSGQALQDTPLAVTAYGEDQLNVLNVRDLKGLSYSIPNVSMDEVGTKKGTANFSFRGLGISSSIPSIDPTVGVFVDGVYLGVTAGVVLDQFDMSGIEVLRGPQGLLFGRNVTGGAVLVNTKNPTEEFEGNIRAAVETGLNTIVSASVSGPLIEDKLLGKLAVYRNDDDGYFKNEFDGDDDFGASATTLIRGALTYFPNETSELKLKYERGMSDGDGPAAQNHALFERDTDQFSVDEKGFYDIEWDFASLSYTTDLGDGVLTNIVGYRNTQEFALGDIDATPGFGYHAYTALDAEQFSNELRYNIALQDWIDVTAGVYYFTQEMTYVEQRLLAGGALDLSGGGTQDQSTWGLFTSVDWRLTDSVTLTTGLRYTAEEKDVEIATIQGAKPCDYQSISCSSHNFVDGEDWANVTPKLGVQWFVDDNTQLYANYSKGFRSGGYNLRNTSPSASPGPFDEEEQDAFEVGVKLDALDGKIRFNAAAFHNTLTGMQREVIIPDDVAGTVQIIQNTADATIDGIEVELTAAVTEKLILGFNLGVIDSDYDEVLYDISGDGVVTDADKHLALPRLSPVSYGTNLTWQDTVWGDNTILARVSYSRKDQAAYSDNNRGFINGADMIDVNLSLTTADDAITVSVFGRNLKDEVINSADALLPQSPLFGYSGGAIPSFTPLSKGRTYGAEIRYNF